MKFVWVSFGDILIYRGTWEDHLKHIDEVLCILEQCLFYAKVSKCEYGVTEIMYLVYKISAQRVSVDENKINKF